MTDPTAETAAATPERSREGADEEVRMDAKRESTAPVASMDVAPELFPTGAAGDGTERGAE